jgi:hypothetical protein
MDETRGRKTSWAMRRFTIELNTTYREFMDWFDREYPDIKRKDSSDGWINLEFKNFFFYQSIMRIRPVSVGIRVEVMEFHPGLNPWSPGFKEKARLYFGEVSIIKDANIVGVWRDMPYDFDILCQHAGSSLGGYCLGWTEARFEKLPDGRAAWHLSQNELGDYGRMVVTKRPDNKSNIEFFFIPCEEREPTAEEIMTLPPSEGGKARVNACLQLNEIIAKESEELDRRRKEHLSKVIDVFFRRLNDEGLLSSEKQEETSTMASRKVNPQPVNDPIDKKILELIEKDPELTDKEIGQNLGLSRQSVNARRRALKKMGHKVR